MVPASASTGGISSTAINKKAPGTDPGAIGSPEVVAQDSREFLSPGLGDGPKVLNGTFESGRVGLGL